MVGRYTHARQFKRGNLELRFRRTRLGRLIRKIAGDPALTDCFETVRSLAGLAPRRGGLHHRRHLPLARSPSDRRRSRGLPADIQCFARIQTQIAGCARPPSLRRPEDFDIETRLTQSFGIIGSVNPDMVVLSEATFPLARVLQVGGFDRFMKLSANWDLKYRRSARLKNPD